MSKLNDQSKASQYDKTNESIHTGPSDPIPEPDLLKHEAANLASGSSSLSTSAIHVTWSHIYCRFL
jgi:hypothetical protein